METDIYFNSEGFFDYTFSNKDRERIGQTIYTEVNPNQYFTHLMKL